MKIDNILIILPVSGNISEIRKSAILQWLKAAAPDAPTVMITHEDSAAIHVSNDDPAATDIVYRPIGRADGLSGIAQTLEQAREDNEEMLSGVLDAQDAVQSDAASRLATLTVRQRQVMEMVLAGHPSKNIAADLGVSQRTVENHRAAVMKRTGSKSLPDLVRLSIAAI